MFFRNPHLQLALYILLLVMFAGLTVYLAVLLSWYAVLPAMGLLWACFRIFSLFKRLHERVTYFFNAVENEDSTLYFPENIKHKPVRELNQGLNRMNRLIQEVKLRDREQEQYYSLILGQVSTGIIVTDENGNILLANTAAKRLFDYDALRHVEQLKRLDSELYEAVSLLKDGSPHQFVKTSYGKIVRHLLLNATSFLSQGRELRIISLNDISNELDIKELESWQRLIRVLTHEIMNSITPITSLSETLLGYYTSPSGEVDEGIVENTVKGLTVINERGSGLIRFVASYRLLAGLSRPDKKSFVLKELIDNILLLLEGEAGYHRISFRLDFEDRDACIEGDEAQLSQVFINLIKNAIMAVEAVPEPVIEISARPDHGSRYRITISDNGHGIPAELIDQIFIPFLTTREGGSGIGLSLSKQIIRNHGGCLELSSVPGNTRFIISFI